MRNPFAPLIAIPRRDIPCTIAGSGIGLKFRRLQGGARIIELLTVRETHLAKKALRMRLPIAHHRRIPVKERHLQRHE
jgi:hypothetical protein